MKKNLGLLLALLIFVGLCSCASSQNPSSESSPLRLYIFECGSILAKDISLWSPGFDVGQKKALVASCYLIRHPKGFFLWDSGLSDALIKEPKGTMENPRSYLTVKKPFLAQLKEIGVNPSDIKFVAFSHFHGDHVGNANAFEGATLFIQQQEYDAAFGAEPKKFGFDPKYYDALRRGPIQKLNGDFDVFGDKSIIIKAAPGHTPGHQTLLVNLVKTGSVLLSGDLYHFTKNRDFKRVPSFNWSQEESVKSIDSIENFLKSSKASLWIQHDLEQNQTLRHAPEYYE